MPFKNRVQIESSKQHGSIVPMPHERFRPLIVVIIGVIVIVLLALNLIGII